MDATLRLLVIDDDDIDRRALKRALLTCGYQYELSEYDIPNSIPELGLLKDFDCIFLDYLLPGDNGLLLIKKIRDNGIQTPVVIITSQGNESIAVELMKAGASDYLVKDDINGQSLRKVLRNVLAMREVVNEREEAQQALRVSESRLKEAQRIAKIGNWEFDPVSKKFLCSEQVYKLTGLDRNAEVTFENLMNCVDPGDRDRVIEAWHETLNGNALNFDFRLTTTDGIKFANSQGYALYDDAGALQKIVGTIQDITDRKIAETEVLKARELAENSLKVREIFLANMSHEIRTPMNAILGFTDLLYETGITPEQKKYIDAIHFSGENLLVVINDILDLSKIRSGKMTIEKCEFDLPGLIASIVSVMSPKAKEKGLRLNYAIDPHIPGIVKGDPVRLNQVLTNLISNAIKFTDAGGVKLSIHAQSFENERVLIEFEVSDTGIGIPEDKQAAIFDKFVQASSDTTRKYGGSGLGLSIVKSLLELQDGKISLTSQPGVGSAFKIALSFECSDTASVNRSHAISAHDEVFESLQGMKVLIAEDNPVNQLLIRKVLEKAGCRLDIVSNGLEALSHISKSHYEIVLMDIQMPEMDGYEATKKIRSEFPKPLCDVPIIALTAHAFDSDVTRCLAVGMNDYVSKPFKARDLYTKLVQYATAAKETKVMRLTARNHENEMDLTALHQLGRCDATFIDELIDVYDRQTPLFIKKLKAYAKDQKYDALRSLCHQIKSSYGITGMRGLEDALNDISAALSTERSKEKLLRIIKLTDVIISLISTVNEKVKYELKKTA